jgi:cytochrome c oxidase subunit IV
VVRRSPVAESNAPVKQPLATAREHAHPSPLVYVKVALILAVVTAIEVALYYVKISDGLLVSSLLVLSLLKFALVALYFMHLKFDSLLFRRLFITGLLLAIGVYAVVLATFLLR